MGAVCCLEERIHRTKWLDERGGLSVAVRVTNREDVIPETLTRNVGGQEESFPVIDAKAVEATAVEVNAVEEKVEREKLHLILRLKRGTALPKADLLGLPPARDTLLWSVEPSLAYFDLCNPRSL